MMMMMLAATATGMRSGGISKKPMLLLSLSTKVRAIASTITTTSPPQRQLGTRRITRRPFMERRRPLIMMASSTSLRRVVLPAAGVSTMLTSPAASSFSTASWTEYLHDVARTRSFKPTNPLIDAGIVVVAGTDDDANNNADTTTPAEAADGPPPPPKYKLPPLAIIQPHHVRDAADVLTREFRSTETDVLDTLTHEFRSKVADGLLEKMDQVAACQQSYKDQLRTLRQVCSVRQQVAFTEKEEDAELEQQTADKSRSSSSRRKQWQDVINTINEKQQEVMTTVDSVPTFNTTEKQKLYNDYRSALERMETGLTMMAPSNSETKATKKTAVTQHEILAMYNWFGLKTELAKLAGYANVAQLVFQQQRDGQQQERSAGSRRQIYRSLSIEHVKELFATVRENVVPVYVKERQQSQRSSSTSSSGGDHSDANILSSYLGPSALPQGAKLRQSAVPTSAASPVPETIRLQDHVLLDAALAFLAQLTEQVLGVTFVEEDEVNLQQQSAVVWNPDVRLFHVYDCDSAGDGAATDESSSEEHHTKKKKYIGSFYLDPYARDGKLHDQNGRSSLTLPVTTKRSVAPIPPAQSPRPPPLVCMSLSIKSPILWRDADYENNPAALTWEDADDLFYEIGHVIQQLLLNSNDGGGISKSSTRTIPYDVADVLPKFMELWMMEKSTIRALVGEVPASEEDELNQTIDRTLAIRRQHKLGKTVDATCLGDLEMTLFAEYDINAQQESIMALQQRIQDQYGDAEKDDKATDFRPLLRVMHANLASGGGDGHRPLTMYRDLLCTCLSTSMFDKFKDNYNDPNNTNKEAALAGIKTQIRRFLSSNGDDGAPMAALLVNDSDKESRGGTTMRIGSLHETLLRRQK